jgi:hypothetical protein
MMQQARLVVIVSAALVCAAGIAPAFAQSGPTASPAPASTELRTQFGASINNAGAQQSLEWMRRRSWLQTAAVASVTPSNVRAGVWAQVTPVPFIVVRAGVEPAYYFGTFDSLMTFESRNAPFDPDSRKDRGGATTGSVLRWYVSPTFRFRVGRIVGAATADVERWSSSASGNFFYEPTRDTLLATGGDRLTALRHVVMYEHVKASGTSISIGGIHTLQRVNGFKSNQLNQVEKLGVLVVTQSEGRLGGLARPSLILSVSRYLDDPSKEGGWTASVSAGVSLRRR